VRIADFTELDLFQHEQEIQEITIKASYKQKLASQLEAMQADMDTVLLSQSIHRGQTFLIANYQAVSETLLAHIVKTEAICGSEFMEGRLLKRTEKWLQQLTEMLELMQEAEAFQKKWVELEPTFGEAAAIEFKELKLQVAINKHTMPASVDQYKTVTKFWESTMQSVQDDPSLTQNLAYQGNIKQEFQTALRTLTRIEEALEVYVDEQKAKALEAQERRARHAARGMNTQAMSRAD
jgi:hypothetical protein